MFRLNLIYTIFFFLNPKYIEWTVKVLILDRRNKIKVFHAHGLKALPVCVLAKFMTGSALIYDAHELETEANGIKGKIKVICKIFEKLLINFSDEVITVSESISKYYNTQNPNIYPVVVRNVPQINNQDLAKSNLRENSIFRVRIYSFYIWVDLSKGAELNLF